MADSEDAAGSQAGQSGADAAGAVAMALGRGGHGGEADAEAAAFLRDQRRLVNLQIENLEEDRGLQHRHLALKYFGDRLRIGLQLLAIAFGVAAAAALGGLAWQAHNEHGLVIEAFSVPPSMAQDGLTGEVVAARFLDQLQALQAATRSERPPATYQNNWGSQIRVEIPETGVTFAEFERLLRDKLGHASHVTGELVRTPAGVALTARLGGATPQTFRGAESDLDALAEKAAEDVYRTSQPYLYAEYLHEHGRVAEAAVLARDLAANGPQGERAWAYALLSGIDLDRGDLRASRADIAQGLEAGGEGAEWVKISQATVSLWSGHDEALFSVSRELDQSARKRLSQITEAAFQENRLISRAYLAGQVGDYAKAAADYAKLASPGRAKSMVASLDLPGFYLSQIADLLALNHDVGGASAALAGAMAADDVRFYMTEADSGFYALPAYQVAAARGDWPAALARLRATEALIEAQKAAHPVIGLMQPTLLRPLEAQALARTGDLAGAETLIASTPLDCYRCLRVRAEVAAARGDWPAAERWFAEAVRQAPSIPFAYAEWAEARLARGDPAGAIVLFRTANLKGPGFADPLKGWGDALARQGLWSEAVAKYDAALKDAPAWRALRRSHDAAARYAG